MATANTVVRKPRYYVEGFRSPKNNEFYWRIKANNHQIVAVSEGYLEKRKRDAAAKAMAQELGSAFVQVK